MKPGIHYFPHDTDAISDEKIQYLIAKHGIWVYGMYWALIEKMHAQPDGRLTLALVDGFALQYKVDLEAFKAFFDSCVITKLFVIENDKYFSERVLENHQNMKNISEKRAESGRLGMAKRWDSNKKVITNDNVVITKITNKKKLKEIKLNDGEGTTLEGELFPTKKGPDLTSSIRPEVLKRSEFVYLTDREINRLIGDHGQEGAERIIEILDCFKANAPGKCYGKDGYLNDYKVILNWVIGRHQKEQAEARRTGVGPPRNPFAERCQEIIEEERRKAANDEG